ncbi:MAG: Y-family DNA polymerase, partial [Gaiellales bacterium]
SCAEALRRCPNAVFVPPDHRTYREWSRRVWGVVGELAQVVEQIGIDEGYLELAPGDPGLRAGEIQAAIRSRVRLSCSLGVASCKVVAKIASDMKKPGGITVVPPAGEAEFLAPLAVRRLPGVGPKAELRLADAGVATIGELAALDDDALGRVLGGRVGEELRRRAQGIDPRPVLAEPAEAVSISSEETFDVDLTDREALHDRLRKMAGGLAEALVRREATARTVTAKLRYPDFSIVTRSHSLTAGTADPDLIGELACRLLDRALEQRPGALRLVGVGVSGFERHEQLTLL